MVIKNMNKHGIFASLPLGLFSILFFIVIVCLLYLLTIVDEIKNWYIGVIFGYFILFICATFSTVYVYKLECKRVDSESD